GMENITIHLPADSSMDTLLAKIEELNRDDSVDGILVQLPLPKGLEREKAILAIDPTKDVDGLHPLNAGALMTDREGFIPCTPKGIIAMLESIGLDDLSHKRAVVVGRSLLVGKPVAMLLQRKNATVTVVHSKTADIESVTNQADILVVATGVPKMVKAGWVKDGAVVIDVGIHRMEDGKLCGDVDYEEVKEKCAAITPVPKGVGPMTVCMLLENTYQAYCMHEGKE
ncbi:MAG: bifunctional 5,10-methylenetetrahydrofolate dehydrogenase/5,10-methenyltetrahydrofolate cyclohydrolase, partial [Erysipelotrichaceae bacterium]|nr:bifunctional 5,10-methylenetetrahydrofolate dehydrogenase/5,10-methenyltetrahydrofolate cyclohydrolase [Erysipelotrichaceae bacterium]